MNSTVGIRREDKNEWERRAPLTPDHVASLVRSRDVAMTVQPFDRRAFPDEAYLQAGATVAEDLSGCRVILGVKEPPVAALMPDRTYLFFSHTTKGQSYNMPLLRGLLKLGCTLIDYERIVDDDGRRLIFFGRHAGYAGMIDTLWAIGQRFASEGIATPLERVKLAHEYASLDEATHSISRLGERLRHDGLPDRLHPLVCGFTGSGNVTLGAREIYERLPTVQVRPDELPELAGDPDRQRNVLYTVAFSRAHRFARIDGGGFDAAEFEAHPQRYRGDLARWFPYLTVLVHGAFWAPPQPPLITRGDIQQAWSGSAPPLRVIADISCDIAGGIEATVRATTPGDPVFIYDPTDGSAASGVTGHGPVILSVDNLPCQLPAESSEHFGDTLVRWVPTLAQCPWERPLDELPLPEPLVRAVVTHQGHLTPAYRYLQQVLDATG